MIVNGIELTAYEENLLYFADVADVDVLRDPKALSKLKKDASIMGQKRLQKQIDALEYAASLSADVIRNAKG